MNFAWKLATATVEFMLVEGMVPLGFNRKPAINYALSGLRCPIQHLAIIERVILL